MKRVLLIVFGLLTVSGLAFAYSGTLDYFSARPDGDGISVEWRSGAETGIKSYAVERSDARSNDFTEITSVSASGSNSYYKYHDGRVNAIAPAGQNRTISGANSDTYKYRLRMNLASEISYSQTITVTKPSSGVRRTWGMIKEMFH